MFPSLALVTLLLLSVFPSKVQVAPLLERRSIVEALLQVDPSSLQAQDADAHGCKPSAGEMWCETTQVCIRLFETECPILEIDGESDADEDEEEEDQEDEDKDGEEDDDEVAQDWTEEIEKVEEPQDDEEEEESESEDATIDGNVPEKLCAGCDKDQHGCKASAGYVWCESVQECIRPFETECPLTAEVGDQEPAPISELEDQVSTTIDTPESDSEPKEDPKEDSKEEGDDTTIPDPEADPEADADEHGCKMSASEMWCEAKQACVPVYDVTGCDVDERGCSPSDGTYWCEALAKCVTAFSGECPQ